MGRSLRSKSKLRAKAVKRKGEFSKVYDERSRRLADKSSKSLEEQTAKQSESGEQAAQLDSSAIGGDESMAVDKKISTSGWRDSRKQIYKQRKLKKKKVMKF